MLDGMLEGLSPAWARAYQLLEDPYTTELVINAYDNWFIKRDGVYRRDAGRFENQADYIAWLNHVLGKTGTAERIDHMTPFIEAAYISPSVHARVHVVCPPVCPEPALTIAKQTVQRLGLEDFVANETMNGEMANFLYMIVAGRLNTVISGGTGSGKTTMLNAMLACANPDERMVVIQEVPEISLSHPNITYLEARAVRVGWRSLPAEQMLGMFGEWAREIVSAGKAAAGELTMRNFLMHMGQQLDATYTGGALTQVTMNDLVKQAMRMRPHRVIVGEIRGSEIVDWLIGANSGHDGSMTTIHASSARDAVYKLETLAQMRSDMGLDSGFARMLISSAVDVIVQLSPAAVGQHRVVEILEVERNASGQNVITTTPLFRWDPRQGHVMVNRPSSMLRERLAQNGVVNGG